MKGDPRGSKKQNKSPVTLTAYIEVFPNLAIDTDHIKADLINTLYYSCKGAQTDCNTLNILRPYYMYSELTGKDKHSINICFNTIIQHILGIGKRTQDYK